MPMYMITDAAVPALPFLISRGTRLRSRSPSAEDPSTASRYKSQCVKSRNAPSESTIPAPPPIMEPR